MERKEKMSMEQFRKTLPEKLNKYGKWLLKHYEEEPTYEIQDMDAVLK